MTSDGSAITRLHRAIANPRASAMQIRAIGAELGAEAVRAYADLLGLPEEWTVHVEVSMLAGPANGQDAPGSL